MNAHVSVSAEGERAIVIRHVFHAPVVTVLQAMTKPELMKNVSWKFGQAVCAAGSDLR